MDATAKKSWWKTVWGLILIILIGFAALGALMSALGITDDQANPAERQTTESVAETETEPTLSTSDATNIDITNEIKTIAGNDRSSIKSASGDGPIAIDTSLVDPGTAGPNEDTAAAMRICQAVATEYPDRNIRVNEDDGTGWMLLRTSEFRDYPIGECFEY